MSLPHVAMAVFCQRLDRQPDGTVDVIGIVDGVRVSEPLDAAEDAPPVVRLTALISVRAGGELRGRGTLALRGWFPSGAEGPTLPRSVEFTDDQPAATLAIPIELEVAETGTYWFDVFFDNVVLTRIPLIIQHE